MRKNLNVIAAYSIMMGLIILVGIFQSWNIALSIFNLCLISAVMTMGANIQWGYAGLINFGIMGFTALGGLAAVLISVDPVQEAWSAGGFNIIFSLLSGESEREVQNIFVPILPIPLNKAMEFKNLQSFHLMFLQRLKHIIKPSLTILIGDKAISLISPSLGAKEDEAMKENQYFSIPELEYMMSVPEVKKTVWEEWKQKRRTLKNELFL